MMPSLSAGTVAVWLVELDALAKHADNLISTLSADEQERARRFHFQRDRDRFTAARSFLRHQLAHYIGRPALSLRFDYGPAGKPSLQRSTDEPDIRFNLSHSGDYALLAIALGLEVGIDIEQMRPEIDLLSLANHHFSSHETAELKRCPRADQITAFYRIWSRKEACIKAVGLGLQVPLDSFSVPLGATLADTAVRVNQQPVSLHAVHAVPHYTTALAVCGDSPIRVYLHELGP